MNRMVLLSLVIVSAPNWVKMPLLPPSAAKAGLRIGGEGAQWPRGPIAVSPADPDFLLLPIDVGGLYRSLDGGRTWEISLVGWDARGANGFGIDPKNASRVIGIAANSMNWNEGRVAARTLPLHRQSRLVEACPRHYRSLWWSDRIRSPLV